MADDVTFTTNAPETVEVGEQFRVQFMLNVDGGDFFEINIADFKIISGPTKSSSNNIQWVNGQMLQKTTSTFSLILMAEYEGKYTIPSASIKYDGEKYFSNPVTIDVVAASSKNANTNYRQQKSTVLATTSNSKTNDDAFNTFKKNIEDNAENEILNSSVEGSRKKSAFISSPSINDNIDTRLSYFDKSKYDEDINWNTTKQYGIDIGDLRAEAQGGWGRFKDAIIGDEIYRGKEYESKSPGEKVFTSIFWAIVLQKSRPILLILIVVAIVIFVRRRR